MARRSEGNGPGAPHPDRTRRRRFARFFLSPRARRLAAEHRVETESVTGTGGNGRITGDDVLAFVADAPHPSARQPAAGTTAPPAPPAPSQPPPPPPASPSLRSPRPAPPPPAVEPAPASVTTPVAPSPALDRGDEVVPLTRIRRLTGEHMVRSKATAPHALSVVEVDFHRVEPARRAAGLTYLPFIARAVVDAIARFPHVNATVGDAELTVHRDVHLGIAVDLDFEGLVVPVVRNADGKRLRAIAGETRDLAHGARSKRLSPDALAGGTFTITNPGPYGTMLSVPIINQPQVAILATDGVKRRPVVVELDGGGDAIAIHPVGLLALSWDHRAFDGAYASAFLALVRELLETRDWGAEL